jgi:hypothetical protein
VVVAASVVGADSQWADTMRIDDGLSSEADQSASSRVHTGSSASGGAPWLRKIAGIRLSVSSSATVTR